MTREEVLEAAISIGENDDRKTKYGTPERSFGKIRDLWNAYIHNYSGATENIELTEMDVAVMMALMKIARISTGVQQDDSFVDAVNYLALAAEMAKNEVESYIFIGNS